MTTITTSLPSTGFEQPSDKEILALMKIVYGAHPDLRGNAETFLRKGRDLLGTVDDFEVEFGRAFVAVGYAFRTVEPVTTRYFHSLVEDANALLRRYWGAKPVSGTALLAAIIAHGDVCWRPANRAVGQLLEVGLDPYSGVRCANAWRGILEGRPLHAPLPPRRAFREAAEPSPVRLYRQQDGPAGPSSDVSGAEGPLWQR